MDLYLKSYSKISSMKNEEVQSENSKNIEMALDKLEQLMEENKEVLLRLKER